MKGILIRGVLFFIFVVGGSYLFEVSYLGAAILVTVVSFLGAVVTEGEYMPGEIDNPDGTELHPYKLLAGITVTLVLLILLAYLFPYLNEFGVYGS
tara:strand:- start:9048 stop:9335 length:288 start_codon:yes stop_codon:yes gene_type:complete